MSDLLSQDEVDALLKGVSDGAIPTGAAGAARGAVRTIELTSQEMSLRGRLPGLERLVDQLVRALGRSLGGLLGRVPEVTVTALELERYATLMGRVQPPVCLQLFRMPPLRGHGLVIVGPGVVAAFLERLLGGSASRRAAVAAREPSAIELRVVERIGTQVLRAFDEAWRAIESVEASVVRVETNPVYAAIAAPEDLVVRLELGIGLDGGETGLVTVCIPNATLDPVRERLRTVQTPGIDGPAPEATFTDRLREALGDAECEVSAELGSHLLTLREVLNLHSGDVLPLRTGRDGPIVVRVEGRARFLAAPGVSGGANAVRVTGRL